MGKIKYADKIREFFKRNAIVDINSLKRFIIKNNGKKDYVYLLLNNMTKKGEIKRITKGYYSLYEDPVLAVFCFRPSYLGLQSALSIHNLWEQETIPVIITSKTVRLGIRKVDGSNILLKRVLARYFFGFKYVKDGEFYVPVSDIEKTFLDMVYFNQKMDEDLLKELKNKINRKKLKDYLKEYPLKFSLKALRFLDEHQ